MISSAVINRMSRRAVTNAYIKDKNKNSKLLRPRKISYNLDSINSIDFGRKLGAKDKKKRKSRGLLAAAGLSILGAIAGGRCC